MGFDLGSIHTALNAATNTVGQKVATQLNAAQGKDLSDTELLGLQHELNRWNIITSLQSNVMKTMADGLKSTIQNMR